MGNTKKQASSKSNALIAVAVLCVTFFLVAIFANTIESNSTKVKTEKCAQNGQVLDDKSGACREKTVSEKFNEKCLSNMVYHIGDKTLNCSQISKMGLEKAFVNNTIIQHGDKLYEEGTSAEIVAGKETGDYCLSASDAWLHIGEKKCVVFNYSYMACSNGYCFLDEKKDYTNGFVAFFGSYRMYSWDNFVATYKDKGPVLVCGTIYSHDGHPEIKVTNVSSQVVLEPTKTYSGNSAVYRYSCK